MKIALATSGMWRLRKAIALVAGAEPCRLSAGVLGMDAIAGWGHKPTASRARQIARRKSLPYIAFEDGFLRSVFPGNGEKPLSLVMDRTGIYYDATQPNDLEALVRRRADSLSATGRIRASMDRLRQSRLSKYNTATLHTVEDLGLRTLRPHDRVLVIDQTAGDASIAGARSSEQTFAAMLVAAVAENPGAELLVRVHPETVLGRKPGHFSSAQIDRLARMDPGVARARDAGLLRMTSEPVNPWALLEACSKVYCVSSQLGFEGLMAGCEVHCFGSAFYNGWGLAIDRTCRPSTNRTPARLEALFAAVYFDYMRYISYKRDCLIEFDEAVDILSERVNEFRTLPRL